MRACTFFGHRDAPKQIEPILRSTLEDMINNEKVELFYVGNQGAFDGMARKVLKSLKQKYPHIRYAVVLAYMPKKKVRMKIFQILYTPMVWKILRLNMRSSSATDG